MVKRNTMLVFLLPSLLLVLSLLPIYLVNAGATVAVVWTTDVNGDPKVEFDLGETVCVNWKTNGNVNITIYYQDATIEKQWPNLPAEGNKCFVPDNGAGYYSINCTGCAEQKLIAYGTFFVIPEVLLGTFGTVVAAVASMITLRCVGVRRRKK
jgi:hypothetical protein